MHLAGDLAALPSQHNAAHRLPPNEPGRGPAAAPRQRLREHVDTVLDVVGQLAHLAAPLPGLRAQLAALVLNAGEPLQQRVHAAELVPQEPDIVLDAAEGSLPRSPPSRSVSLATAAKLVAPVVAQTSSIALAMPRSQRNAGVFRTAEARSPAQLCVLVVQ